MDRRAKVTSRALAAAVAGLVACGGLVEPQGTHAPVEEAGAQDASLAPDDVSVTLDAPPPETSEPIDTGSVPDEAAADASSLPDGAGDAAVDAPADTGPDASPGCHDTCTLADTQCVWTGAHNDGVATCVVGPSGCTVWGPATIACTMTIACCVPCTPEPCSDGSVYMCANCPVGPRGSTCMQDTDCGTDSCNPISQTCASSQCSDQRRDGQETDVDCGGIECDACPSGGGCETNFDCQSGICVYPSHVCF